VVVIEDADARRLNDGKQPAFLAHVKLLGMIRPTPWLIQDPAVDAELEVGVDTDVEGRILDLDAGYTAHVRSG